jgi:hypothetical protein
MILQFDTAWSELLTALFLLGLSADVFRIETIQRQMV